MKYTASILIFTGYYMHSARLIVNSIHNFWYYVLLEWNFLVSLSFVIEKIAKRLEHFNFVKYRWKQLQLLVTLWNSIQSLMDLYYTEKKRWAHFWFQFTPLHKWWDEESDWAGSFVRPKRNALKREKGKHKDTQRKQGEREILYGAEISRENQC